jgi:hypothetical protein
VKRQINFFRWSKNVNKKKRLTYSFDGARRAVLAAFVVRVDIAQAKAVLGHLLQRVDDLATRVTSIETKIK